MKVVLLSDHGDAGFILRRMIREGHDGSMHIFDPASRRVADGLIPKLDTPTVPDGTDLVLFDATDHGTMGQALRRRGIPVIGGNPLDHDLEVDRTKGTAFMRTGGIAVPETHTFSSLASGQGFLLTHPGHWYFKPSGDGWGTDWTRNGDSEAVARFLRWCGKQQAGIRSYQLQRTVKGCEVSCEGWFDGTDFVRPFNATLETKKYCAGDLGARTGCQANVVWTMQDDVPPLARDTVMRITPLLRAAHYVGPIDLNCIVDQDGEPHGLEWSARTGFDALQAYSMLLQGDVAKQLRDFATGKLRRWDVRPGTLGLTLRLSTTPYPLDDPALAKDSLGLPLDSALFREPGSTFLDDVMVGTDGKPAMAGRDGSIGCVGTTGTDWSAMSKTVLKRAKAIDLPSKAYRVDVIPDAMERWTTLADAGYLRRSDVPAFTGLQTTFLHDPAIPQRRDDHSGDADQGPPMAPFVHDITEGEAAD